MRRLKLMGLCLVAVFALTAAAAASASAAVPTWYECAKAEKVAKTYPTGEYSNKECTAAEAGGKYRLKEGLGKGKAFKGKGGTAVLHVKTWLGDDTVECEKSKDSGTPVLPNLEKEVTVTYSKCKALDSATKACTSAGAKKGEIKVTGLKGELGYVEESPVAVGLKLESEAHPGPSGELAKFNCGEEHELEVTLIGGVIGVQGKDVNVVSKESELVYVASAYIGEHEFDTFKYTPLVNIVGWADEQEAIAIELEEDLKGEISKLIRPIVKTAICGTFIESLLKVHCAPEAYAGLDSTAVNKGEALEIKA